ncbi:MAG: hypothetical protein WCT23_01955 [Candidatus Neomarinimicrobiota bacterium]
MKKSGIFFVLIAVLLSSCLLPNNYELNVVLLKDGSFDMLYEGELIYTPVLDAISKGEYDKAKKKEFNELVQSLEESEGYTSVKNKGKGTIEVKFKKSVDESSDFYFLDKDFKYYSFLYNSDGELSISGFEVDKNSKEGLKAFNIKLSGQLRVQVPKNLDVTQHNADKSKKLDKNTMEYSWKLDLNSKKPEMLIKL